MSRATPDDQLRFLLSCVKFSNNGKIDFVEVARECSVVSKGAAAKRYERLLKANGIQPGSGTSAEKTLSDTTPRIKKVTKPETNNKRKRHEYSAEIGKHEGDDENTPQRHVKRERPETPYMHETPMNSRGPAYNHYMHPHSSYMHGAMSPFLHQTMRPSSQYPMIPPPHVPYGNISGVVPNHPFMMPQQSISSYPVPQTMQSSSLHDSSVDSNNFEHSYYTAPQNNIDMNSIPLHNSNFLEPVTMNSSAMPLPSIDTGQQIVITPSPDTKPLVKHEHDSNILPSSFLDYLVTDVKVEGDSTDQNECAGVKTTDVSINSNATEAESTRNAAPLEDRQSQSTVTSHGECDIKKEETTGPVNECIFISD